MAEDLSHTPINPNEARRALKNNGKIVSTVCYTRRLRLRRQLLEWMLSMLQAGLAMNTTCQELQQQLCFQGPHAVVSKPFLLRGLPNPSLWQRNALKSRRWDLFRLFAFLPRLLMLLGNRLLFSSNLCPNDSLFTLLSWSLFESLMSTLATPASFACIFQACKSKRPSLFPK